MTAFYWRRVPKNTPDQIIDALNKEINLGLADPNIKARLAELGSTPLEVIAQVNDDEDVKAAVKFARAKKLKAAVRGGGHNRCAPSLCDRGLLIDLAFGKSRRFETMPSNPFCRLARRTKS